MWGCENGHPFNIAKEGYVNLLLSHQRKSKTPGDDPEMVRARRRFFDSGAFAPLTRALVEHPLFERETLSVLDVGCGEGHLLGALSENRRGNFFGTDIAKKAVQMAAKRYASATWFVANGMRSVPVADASMDVILSVLAPRNPAEFKRILKPDGALLIGVPGPNHLIELREKLQFSSGDFAEKADTASTKASGFKEISRVQVRDRVTLNAQHLADLIRMTPIFWRSSHDAKERLGKLESLSVTTCFTLLTLRPDS